MFRNLSLLAAAVVLLCLALPASGGEIHRAIEAGDVELVKQMLEKDPGALTQPDDGQFREPPLLVAAATGNVEIAPVIIHVNGLSIRVIEPEPQPAPGRPVVSQTEWSKFDTSAGAKVKLQQLIDALDQLNVPVRDKINTIYEISRAGALRASIRSEY